MNRKTILQIFPQLKLGGLERGAIETAIYLSKNNVNSIVVAASGNDHLYNMLMNNNVRVIFLPIGKKSFFNASKLIFTLRKLIKQLKPDLIHVRSRLPTWITYIASRGTHTPLVTSAHGYHSEDLFKLKRIYNRAIFMGDSIIMPSTSMLNHYKSRYKFDQSKTYVMPPGIDTQFFSRKAISTIEINKLKSQWDIKEQKVILFPTRISSRKGILTFIKAISYLKSCLITPYKAIVFGPIDKSSYYEQCLKLINHYQLESMIRIHPPPRDIRVAYSLASIVVSCSIKPESFGRVICEAMSMEKIVIVSALGGIVDIINHNQNGFLFENNNEQALKAQIKFCLTMPDSLEKTITQKARASIVDNYDSELIFSKSLQLYNKTILEH